MTCSLCCLDLPVRAIRDGDLTFCCAGCHAVYSVLSTKNQISNFQDQPIFQQALKAGLISNPDLLEQLKNRSIDNCEREKLHLEVSGLWCPACCELIKLLLLQEKGIFLCIVDYATDLAVIEYAPRYISKQGVYDCIQRLGYQTFDLDAPKPLANTLNLRFIIAAFCAFNIMMFSYPIYSGYFNADPEGYGLLFAWLSCVASLPVVFYSAWPIYRRFYHGLKIGLLGMETLVVIGVSAAFALSIYELFKGGTEVYFDSLSVIIAFVLLGKILESKAKFSAKNALLYLFRSLPKKARKKTAEGSCFVPIKDLAKEDHFIVLTGEKIVLDGVVVEGQGVCDESLVSGESIPVMKKIGSNVIGGSLLQNGHLVIRVINEADRSTLFKIIEMIQHNIEQKTTQILPIDRIIAWFIPTVLVIALLSAGIMWLLDEKTATETALIRAISILLISCPCAIGIAAPLAESHLINRLAALGAIVRNKTALAYLGKETLFVFDKTGTVTEGKFKLLTGWQKLTKEELSILKTLASCSNHPISRAIAEQIDAPLTIMEGVEEVIGKGMHGVYRGVYYRLGSEGFTQAHSKTILEEASILSKVYFASEHHLLAELALGDLLRPGVIDLIPSLPKAILLSGDASEAVRSVAEQCCFETWHAKCSPLEKRELIAKYRNEGAIVCMVGDGINDAPALTTAHVGISVVTAADISIQVSDFLLTSGGLSIIQEIRKMAQKGHRILKQNLFWAFFYNVIGIVLAVFGYLTPLFSAFAMTASSLMVLFNAKRLQK